MTDRPILFSAPMVRALLEGRKTQTRRVLKLRRYRSFSQFGPSDTPGYDWHFRDAEMRWQDYRNASLAAILPFAPGDRLWVREALYLDELCIPPFIYSADEKRIQWSCREQVAWLNSYPRNKVPPIHMPRWASRLTLLVTEVRVERLQDISCADAIAEGCPALANSATIDCDTPDPREAYRDLWNSINGAGAWDANPWCCAVSFEVINKNIDEVGK